MIHSLGFLSKKLDFNFLELSQLCRRTDLNGKAGDYDVAVGCDDGDLLQADVILKPRA